MLTEWDESSKKQEREVVMTDTTNIVKVKAFLQTLDDFPPFAWQDSNVGGQWSQEWHEDGKKVTKPSVEDLCFVKGDVKALLAGKKVVVRNSPEAWYKGHDGSICKKLGNELSLRVSMDWDNRVEYVAVLPKNFCVDVAEGKLLFLGKTFHNWVVVLKTEG